MKTSRKLNLLFFMILLVSAGLAGCKKDKITTKGEIIFNPDLAYGSLTDQDGNTYKTITIGTQTWMAENLRTTKYRNGDPISHEPDSLAWEALTTGAYCWYANDESSNRPVYGALYNWYAMADSRNIAPEGWHIPGDAEWATLTTFLENPGIISSRLKETGTAHWNSPYVNPFTPATNETGFTALPGGQRYFSGRFKYVGEYGSWWSSTEINGSARSWLLSFSDNLAYNNEFSKNGGCSVRCLKD